MMWNDDILMTITDVTTLLNNLLAKHIADENGYIFDSILDYAYELYRRQDNGEKYIYADEYTIRMAYIEAGVL